MDFTFHEIGHVENTCNELAEPAVIRALHSRIIIHPALAEGLSGFQPGDRLLVLFVFHRIEDGYELMQRPRKDPTRAPRGVFTLCSPRRPNPIGATAVDLLEIQDNVLLVAGLDAVNGTPILDIKPAFKSL
ncbi:MAG: SAM-dependent methyltransferase [Chloroflexi bacterium]|nr:SAM-dependent methyltransferase [Chloroflexota bacterium]